MKVFLVIFLMSISVFAEDKGPDKSQDKTSEKATDKKDDARPREDQKVKPDGKEKDTFFAPQVLKNKDALEKEDNLNLLRHQPLYFAYGSPDTKVQLSFKYRIVQDMPLYFAYTQIMFWDLRADSKPFKDSTYNPEFIYTYDIKRKIFLDNIDFGIWEHNSNGKGGDASRSFNRSFIRFNFAREYEDFIVKFSTKFGFMYSLDNTNDDIRNYISPLELKLSFIGIFKGLTIDRSSFDIRYFPGGDWAQHWGKGGYELSTSFRFGGLSIVPAFYMQYFRGYAESLINYNERVSEFRAGFIF